MSSFPQNNQNELRPAPWLTNRISNNEEPADSWASNTTYALNAIVQPQTPNGFVYTVIVAGVSAALFEPTFPTTVGLTVVDNEVTWQNTGEIGSKAGQAFGCPYHGLVGEFATDRIRLGTTPPLNKFYRQPNGGNNQTIGGWLPTPDRDSDAAKFHDEEHGFVWKNTAQLAGRNYRLHGQLKNVRDLEGMQETAGVPIPDEFATMPIIYVDGNNIPWLIKVFGNADFDNPLTNPALFRLSVVLVSRFGWLQFGDEITGISPPPLLVTLVDEHNFSLPVIADWGGLGGNLGSGMFLADSISFPGTNMQQNKKGTEAIGSLQAHARSKQQGGATLQQAFPANSFYFKVEISGDGDLLTGAGISAVVSTHKTVAETWDIINPGPQSAPDSARWVTEELYRVEVDGSGGTISSSSISFADPGFCDDDPADIGNTTTLTYDCTASGECVSELDNLQSRFNWDGALGASPIPSPPTGENRTSTLTDTIKNIELIYYDDDVLQEISILQKHEFVESSTFSRNMVAPIIGGSSPDAWETTVVTVVDVECDSIPDNFHAIEPANVDVVSDFTAVIARTLVSRIESSHEFFLNGVSQRTASYNYERNAVNETTFTLGTSDVDQFDPLTIYDSLLACDAIVDPTDCDTGGDVLTTAADPIVPELEKVVRQIDHTFEINGVEVWSFEEKNTTCEINNGVGGPCTPIPESDYRPFMTGINPGFAPNHPTDIDAPVDIELWAALPRHWNNKCYGVGVNIDITTPGGAGAGSFSIGGPSLVNIVRYELFTGSDDIEGEVYTGDPGNTDDNSFASVDPETKLITVELDAARDVCHV